ncbi:MAG: hypothetical protein JHC33_05405, partial [Ignisphaera sp.]|nr:hypothetical protein [Ignisphaera sp.]
MFKIIHLPTAEYVIDGHSRVDDPQVLYFDTFEEAKERLINGFFKTYMKKTDIIYLSDSQTGTSRLLPNHLFEV